MVLLARSRFMLLFLLLAPGRASSQPWRAPQGIATTRTLSIGGGTIEVDFANGPPLDLTIDQVMAHIRAAATAVTAYYGRFPLSHDRILVIPAENQRGDAIHGTTWGGMDGAQGFTRLRIAQHATMQDLADDWVTTHELVHGAFPSMPDDQHWIEEGLATYIEPLARVMTGELQARKVWADMVDGMPKGEPQPGDEGLDHTHTWGRTYWGGALFCLVADVEIRRETGNRKGLRDALKAIVAAGGTIDHDWDLPRALTIGDNATGTHVLSDMYAKWKDAPVQVDLPKLWNELGIRTTANGIEFVDNAPLANVREAIAGDHTKKQKLGQVSEGHDFVPGPRRSSSVG